jgi:hypothetical protein
MTRHRRRKQLSTISKIVFRESAERFHQDLQIMFRDLTPTGDHYKALQLVAKAIDATYPACDIEPPARLHTGPLRTMEGHTAFPER